MKIVIESIPSKDHRIPTLGDWWFDIEGTLQIRVSNDEGLVPNIIPSENEQFLIALHEMVEAWLCKRQGITHDQVDDFDSKLETTRPGSYDEPGDESDSPYRRQHRFSMMIEHLMAHELGLSGYGVVR